MNTDQEQISLGRIISAMFLVAGTCIGGGMLVLPVATGVSGFLPSLSVMCICWAIMTFTGLLLLEVSLWMEEGVHFITMATRLLGAPGKWISWFLYLFICYASIVGYTAGGGLQISSTLANYFNISIGKELASILFLLLFGIIVDMGSLVVGRINAILFIAMIGAYVMLVGGGLDEINPEHLTHRHWFLSFLAIPLTLTTFSFQTMVPSLTPYLKRHIKGLRWAVIGGTTITFTIYVIWQALILGIIPVEGENSLTEALQRGAPATQFLREHVKGQWIYIAAEYFAFFAIITSFLGIGLGLVDFLADGLKVKKQGWGKLLLGSVIIIPTLIFATQFERVFLVAMEWSGGLGDSILNGMIPILMVWIGRYHLGLTGPYRVKGGKAVLVIAFLCYLVALLVQLWTTLVLFL